MIPRMGTKVQANGFLREYCSAIDLDGSASDGIRSACHGNMQVVEKGQNPNSFTSSALEKVRQTILEHESIFRSQLQELHRLYRRQKELMNEIKRQEINRVASKEVKSQSSFLFSPALPQDGKRIWNAPYLMAGCSSASGGSNKPFPTFLEGKVVPNFPTLQDTRILSSCEPWTSSRGSICTKGMYSLRIQGDTCSGNVEKRIQERFCNTAAADCDITLSLSAVQTSQSNPDPLTFDLYTKRHNACVTGQSDGVPDGLTLARGATANSSSAFNLATKDFFQSRNHHRPDDDYAEKMMFDTRSSLGDYCSGKSPGFPQAEQRKEFSLRKRKLFGVEIEGYYNPSDMASQVSNTLEPKVGPHNENNRVVSSCSSSWIDKSFAEKLELSKINSNGGKTEIPKADSKGENRNWLQRCSATGLSLDKVPDQYAESDHRKCYAISQPAEVLKKDCCDNQENPKGVLPWFLRNSQDSCDPAKGANSPYFMNLDSLQNCSQNFFRKAEMADGTSQVPMQKKETSAAMANDRSSGATKILGFPISDMLQSSENRNPSDADDNSAEKCKKDENKDTVLPKGINNYMSGLKHRIDLNLSLDDEASPSAPSLPTTIVKIATTEIDLEAPAVIESETDAPPKKLAHEECDNIAAEALLAISKNSVDGGTCEPPEAASISRLKWLAEIISSQCHGTTEESIPGGMDYFEYVTLKLEETKEEQHHYEPVVLNHPTDDETGNAASLKRSRRGQLRRGRQRKDFQRDILPGLITLSRLEVTEDLQAFDELMKASAVGSSRQLGLPPRSSTRNGRGKKRAAAATQQPNCQLEDRSLTGWGKRTRRLPRQRCHNTFLSFPVKC